jgi:uncharacterized membrane protein YkvA (DUF1232 family)
MSEKSNRSLENATKSREGVFGDLFNNFRLIVRLLKDRRVNFLLKLLPVGALIYLVSPLDFIPINPLDDAVVLWLGGVLFIELCPDYVVREHRDSLGKPQQEEHLDEAETPRVIDGEFKEVSSEKDRIE